MNLRKKTLLVIGLTFLLLITVGYIYTQTIFLKGYGILEKQEIDANVRRFHYTLDSEINYLGKLTNDWAAWDDTYEFMQNSNEEFVSSNLVDDTYTELELNFTFFLDNSGNPVFEKAFDLENATEIPVENSIYVYLKNLLDISPISDAGESLQGVFSHDGSPVIFAARPILTSLDEGPSRGTLIFGKVLTGVLFDKVKSSVDAGLNILPYSSDMYAALPISGENPDFKVDARRSDYVHFYSLIKDVENTPIFIIEQILPRTIHQQGLSSRREFLIALIFGCFIAGALVMIALEYGFLRRFSKLINGVAGFGASSKNNKEMILKGNDEISNLSNEMYIALSQLADTQNELTTHLDFEKLLVGISTKFINLSVESVDEGINRLLKVIGEFSKADRGYVRLLRSETPDTMDVTHEWRAEGIPSVKESRQNIRVDPISWWIKTLKKGKPIIINDVSLMPDEARNEMELFKSQSVHSLAAIPLIINGEFVGLLAYTLIKKQKDWSEQTTLLLQVIGAVIANVIDRKRHENKILTSQKNSDNLNEITSMSIGKSTLPTASREISKLLNNLINSDKSYLILSDDKNNLDIFSGGRKISPSEQKQQVFKDLLQRTGSGIIKSSEQEHSEIALYKKNLGASYLSLPLSSETANPGIIVLSFNKPHNFSIEEISFCRQSSAQIALTVLKTKALEAARQRSEELSALRATIADITSELELQKLLHTLLERAIKLMKADGGDFCIVDEQTGNLKVVASINIDKEYVGTIIRYGEGASGKVLATKKTLLIDDYSTWPGRLEILTETKLRATVLLPLLKADKVIGTLGIFHSDPKKRFKPEDLHMLSLFAQHASIAMENALLFEKVQEMARIDEVTGLLNRRAFGEMGEYEINRAMRLMHPISLAMLDLDDFKQVNDQFSHLIGDEVLRAVARRFRDKLRNIDIIGRYGGDEMVILMPETDEEKAFIAMERLRKEFEDTPIMVRGNSFHITVSIGVSSHQRNAPNINEMMDQADSSLYAAKKAGKNCVRMYKNNS